MPPRKTAKKRTAKKVARNAVRIGKWEVPPCIKYVAGQQVYVGEYKGFITGLLLRKEWHTYLVRFQDGDGEENEYFEFELTTEQEF